MAFDAFLRRTFPGVRITSGRRDPNSPLGRANPRSWHNQGKAWDTAPIEGMDFKDYVSRIGQDYDILEARDEVNNPSRHATGPHWHVAVGDRKEKPKVNNLASLMQGVYPMARQEEQQPQPTGLAGLLQQGQAPLQPQMQQPAMPSIDPQSLAPKKRPVWKDILGSLLDTFAVAGGAQAGYWPTVQKGQERDDKAREKLEEAIALQKQRMADRAAALEDRKTFSDYQHQNPGPTNVARMLAEAGIDPNSEQGKQLIIQAIQRPIMIGGEAYAPQAPQGGGLPQGYNPDEWEVVE